MLLKFGWEGVLLGEGVDRLVLADGKAESEGVDRGWVEYNPVLQLVSSGGVGIIGVDGEDGIVI